MSGKSVQAKSLSAVTIFWKNSHLLRHFGVKIDVDENLRDTEKRVIVKGSLRDWNR